MTDRQRSATGTQRDRLLRLLALRQTEAPTSVQRIAYWRLEKALVKKANASPDALILGWLEDELRILEREGDWANEAISDLLGQVIKFCEVLRS